MRKNIFVSCPNAIKSNGKEKIYPISKRNPNVCPVCGEAINFNENDSYTEESNNHVIEKEEEN